MPDKHNLLCAGNIMRQVDIDDAGQDCDGDDKERSLPIGKSVAVVVDQDDGLDQGASEKEALSIASLPGKRRHPSGDVAEEFLIPAWVSLQQRTDCRKQRRTCRKRIRRPSGIYGKSVYRIVTRRWLCSQAFSSLIPREVWLGGITYCEPAIGAIEAISAMLRITGRNPETLHSQHNFHIIRKRFHEQFHRYE